MSYHQNINSQQHQGEGTPGGGVPQSSFPNPADMPLQNPKSQIAMWQQNSYMGTDSGIQSGVPSQAPSLSGKEDDMETSYAYGPPSESGYTSEQVEELGQKLSGPGSQKGNLSERMENPLTPYDPSTQSIPGDTNQMINFINNQQENIDYSSHLPEVIKMLYDKDQFIVQAAIKMVLKFSESETIRMALLKSPNFVNTLVKSLLTSNDLDITKVAVEILHNLSMDKEGLPAIKNAGGVEVLVRLLDNPNDRILNCSITTLHTLLLHQEGSKVIVRQVGGVQRMVALLKKSNEKFLAIVADCIRTLALESPESKLVILASNGPRELVKILQNCAYEKLIWTTVRALKVLGCNPSVKPAIVAAGGLAALVKHMNSPSKRVAINCMFALRNLSDEAVKLDNLDYLLYNLINFLTVNDMNVVEVCADTLYNLCCNKKYKKYVVENLGVHRLLDVLRMQNGQRVEVPESAVKALRNLTNPHPLSDAAQAIIRDKPAIMDIINLLHPSAKLCQIKSVIHLIRNLASNPLNQNALRESGGLYKLDQLLMKAAQSIYQPHNSTNSGGGLWWKGPVQDDVSMEDIVESSILVLHLMSEDRMNRMYLRDLNVEAVAKQLMTHHSEVIKREASGILNNLTIDDGIIMKKEEPNPMSPMADMLQNEGSCYEGRMYLQISKGGKHDERDMQHNVELPPGQFYRDDVPVWPNHMPPIPPDFPDFLNSGPDYDPMYGQGPPSVPNGPNYITGYPDHAPGDSMQGLELGQPHGGPGSNYGPMDPMELPPVHPPNIDYDHQVPPPPRKDNPQQINHWHKCTYCQSMFSTEQEASACLAKHLH